MTLLGILIGVAVLLTCTMFLSRQAMLGFPCAIFWALAGGQAYTLSTTTWDIYFIIGFACLLGMVSFTALGAYGLREKRDSLGDESMERGDGRFLDEPDGKPGDNPWMKDGGSGDNDPDPEIEPSLREKRVQGLSQKKPARTRRINYGEFR